MNQTLVAQLEDVSNRHGNVLAFDDVTLRVNPGEVLALLGLLRADQGGESLYGSCPDDVEAKVRIGAVLKTSDVPPTLTVMLKAAPDTARVDRLLSGRSDTPAETVITKTFMFTDIVSSTDLAGSLGDSSWLSVIAWHDRTLRAAFAKHGGVEVRHTGDGFFVAFDSAQVALACAVEIQRQLETNRDEHGSALTVRIGLHLASALEHQGDYAGQGVHVAARVAALGGRGEIVASQAVADEVEGAGFEFSEARAVSVKGVSEPIEVHTVDWR